MGYRSDVAYTIRFEDDHDKKEEQTFYTFLAEAKSKPEYALALKEVTIDEKKRRINFFTTDTKWYPSYPEVDSHEALWALATEYANQDDCCIGGAYAQIGEDDTDIKTRYIGNSYDWVSVERKIITDWD